MKILLVDDHAIVRSGLRRLFGTLAGIAIVEAETGREALALYRDEEPDVVILDLNLPGIGGLELLQRLLDDDPEACVLVFSMHADAVYASRALQTGARGYMSKNADPDEILTAVQRLAEGARYIEKAIAQELALHSAPDAKPLSHLSGRELEILRLLGEGHNFSEIGAEIGISYKTVANTCSQIKTKLGVSRTADLIRLSLNSGVL